MDSNGSKVAARALRTFVVVLAAVSCARASATDIRIAFTLAPDSYQGQGVTHFAALVRERSHGRLNVVALGGGSGGNEAKFIHETVSGTLEMSVPTTTSLVPLSPTMAMWDTPLFFATYQEADIVLDGITGQRAMNSLSNIGLVGLSYWENGFREVTNNLRPINSLIDLKGMRLRVIPTKIAMATFEALGAAPKPLPFPEVLGALASGQIDGQENPLSVIQSARLYTVQRYLSLTHHLYSPFAIVASAKWWAQLPIEDRVIIQTSAYETRFFEREAARASVVDALTKLKAEGMLVNTIDLQNRMMMSYRLEHSIENIAHAVGLEIWIQANVSLLQARDSIRATKANSN